ncbi:MAG: hypothetical protein ACI80V_000920, partial [Rhodothermales bacterium]
YEVRTADPDAGDTRAITGTVVPSWLTVIDNGNGTATLAGTPTTDHVGPHDVELIVTDAAGATATQSFTITVSNTNGSPDDWTVDAAQYSSSMNIVAGVFVSGSPINSLDAVLAAKSAGEVRGVASALLVQGQVVFFLTIHGSGDEPITFEVYSGVEGSSPAAIGPGTTFSPDGSRGTVGAPVVLSDTSFGFPTDWSVDASAYSGSSTLVASVQVDGSLIVHPDAVLAAFDGAEIRGVARATVSQGSALFFIVVYGEATASISFQVFDPSSSSIPVPLGPAMDVAPESSLGSLSSPILLSSGNPGSPPTGWSVDASGFESSMNLVARVVVGGVATDGSGSYLAAFSGTEVRGVASLTVVGTDPLFFLTIHGDSSDPITFQMVDGAGSPTGVGPGIVFAPGAVIGSISQPLVVSTDSSVEVPAAWTVDPAGYTSAMIIVATVLSPSGSPVEASGVLGAFSGSEIRGVASSLPLGGTQVYFLTVYGTGGTSISFEYATGTSAPISVGPNLRFKPDTALGSLDQPLVLRPGVFPAATNAAPVASDQIVTVAAGGSVGITLRASDENGDPLSYLIVSGPSNGTLSGGGALRTYSPAAGYFGTDSFTFNVNDGTVDSNTATVSITVTGVNNPPVFADPDDVFNSPVHQASVAATGNLADVLFAVEWNAAIDPEGGDVSYTWEVSSTPSFTSVLRTVDPAVSGFGFTVADAVEIMNALGTRPGASVGLFHRLTVSDRQVSATSAVFSFVLVRGAVTGVEDDLLPASFELRPNYPNPFNPSTLVRYALPKAGPVTVSVYDARGRLVGTLVNSLKPAGFHEVSFDASNLPSGVYLSVMRAGSFIQTRSLVLQK